MSDHRKDIKYLAEHLLHTGVDGLARRELQALMRISRKLQTLRPEHALPDTGPTFGERLADRVAEFGGSWTFIMIFAAILCGWATVNSVLLGTRAFDPYPYIFLNLMLSMLAAIQAPIIMMSQNRQTARDRMTMIRDFEVNLKSEAAIDSLHKRIDHLTWALLSDLNLIKQGLRAAAGQPVPPGDAMPAGPGPAAKQAPRRAPPPAKRGVLAWPRASTWYGARARGFRPAGAAGAGSGSRRGGKATDKPA